MANSTCLDKTVVSEPMVVVQSQTKNQIQQKQQDQQQQQAILSKLSHPIAMGVTTASTTPIVATVSSCNTAVQTLVSVASTTASKSLQTNSTAGQIKLNVAVTTTSSITKPIMTQSVVMTVSPKKENPVTMISNVVESKPQMNVSNSRCIYLYNFFKIIFFF